MKSAVVKKRKGGRIGAFGENSKGRLREKQLAGYSKCGAILPSAPAPSIIGFCPKRAVHRRSPTEAVFKPYFDCERDIPAAPIATVRLPKLALVGHCRRLARSRFKSDRARYAAVAAFCSLASAVHRVTSYTQASSDIDRARSRKK